METRELNVGDVLREWRRRRSLSQLELAGDAGISARHLSFVESGRAGASRTTLLRLAEELAMTPRARNALLLAAGFAPLYPERSLDAPDMAAAKAAIQSVLAAHEPFPALAVDRLWNLVAANRAVESLIGGADPELLQPPVNVLKLSLDPCGLAPLIGNLAEWRHHLLGRLRLQAETAGDRQLFELHAELSALPSPASHAPPGPANRIAVPLVLRVGNGTLSLLSTTTVFGTATDVTLSEIALECFYPGDAATRAALTAMAGDQE